MATDLCISVLKYSYATGQRSDNTIPWTHVAAPDLFIILNSAKGTDRELTLRAVQGNSVLESIAISKLIDASIEARQRSHQAGIIAQVEQLPIFGITKQNVLALRYRLSDGKARRVQFRIQDPSESLRIAGVLERRGMEFHQQKSTTLRLDTPRPSTAISQGRPPSMQTSSPFFELTPTHPTRPDPFSRPPLEAGSLSSHRPMIPVRPDSRFGSLQRPSQHAAQAMPPPPVFIRDESVMPRDVVPNRPTTAQIFRSSTTPYRRSIDDQPDDVDQSIAGFTKRPPSASLLSDTEFIQQAAGDYDTPPQTSSHYDLHQNVYKLSQPSHSTSAGATAVSMPPAFGTQLQPTTTNSSRPYTMATPGTSEHQVPLHRDLAPVGPRIHILSDTTANSRPTSSSLDLPPLPRPKSVRKDTSPMKTTPNFPAHPATSSPAKRSFATFSEPHVASEPFTSEGRPTDASISPSKTSVTSYEDGSPAKLSPMNELLARKRPLLQRSPNAGVSRLDSLADAPHEVVSPPGTAVSPAKPSASTVASKNYTQPGAVEGGFVPMNNRVVTSMTEQERSSLEAYAAQSQEDRAAAMDDFVMANLENPAFTKLCEDVENCWRRIALGL